MSTMCRHYTWHSFPFYHSRSKLLDSFLFGLLEQPMASSSGQMWSWNQLAPKSRSRPVIVPDISVVPCLLYALLFASHWPELSLQATSRCQGARKVCTLPLQTLWWGMDQQEGHSVGDPWASDHQMPKKDPEEGEHEPWVCKQLLG